MTRIAILTVGSRGDVQPYIALGLGLRAAGHDAVLVADPSLTDEAAARGLPCVPIRADYQALLGLAGQGGLRGKWQLLREAERLNRDLLADSWTACMDAQAIVYHPKALAGYHLAEKLNVPAFLAHPVPAFSVTAAFASPLLPVRDHGPRVNRLTHAFVAWASGASQRKLVNAWREATLGLPPLRRLNDATLFGRPVPRLYGCSPLVVPPPDDWGDAHLTGFWFLDGAAAWRPDARLEAFLAAGPPPVYVGFGSMVGADPRGLTARVVAAVRAAGVRAVLARGWGALEDMTDDSAIHWLEQAPHEWLFPRMAAVVHHGGAGTTAAGLRAGVPGIICPFFGDQPFWGARVHALGVGPRPIAQKRLTVDALAAAIREAVGNEDMQARARALGRAIAAEDGVGHAVKLIGERLAESG
jgi:UDP:flavonoid glycosyltransferase YjiC (YdhE family)